MHFDQSPYFNMTVAACRRAGARGGRRAAEACRLRTTARRESAERSVPAKETAREASMLLDERFPWLRDAWVRRPRHQA